MGDSGTKALESWREAFEPADEKEAGLDLGSYQLAERLPKMHKTPGSMPCIAWPGSADTHLLFQSSEVETRGSETKGRPQLHRASGASWDTKNPT